VFFLFSDSVFYSVFPPFIRSSYKSCGSKLRVSVALIKHFIPLNDTELFLQHPQRFSGMNFKLMNKGASCVSGNF